MRDCQRVAGGFAKKMLAIFYFPSCTNKFKLWKFHWKNTRLKEEKMRDYQGVASGFATIMLAILLFPQPANTF